MTHDEIRALIRDTPKPLLVVALTEIIVDLFARHNALKVARYEQAHPDIWRLTNYTDFCGHHDTPLFILDEWNWNGYQRREVKEGVWRWRGQKIYVPEDLIHPVAAERRRQLWLRSKNLD